MKLCASNIAWEEQDDEQIYALLRSLGFQGLEIAPTRWISDEPYNPKNTPFFQQRAKQIHTEWQLSLASMQSIWYGRLENIFGSENERESIYKYMCEAIDFAHKIGCPHLVFGCPKNRNRNESADIQDGIDVIVQFSKYAYQKGVIIGLEANPAIYGTNFINTNMEAKNLIDEIDIPSLRLNLDFGAIIENKESLDVIENMMDIVSHVHISEPYLNKVAKRNEHELLAKILTKHNYQGYVSLEMKKHPIQDLIDAVEYIHDTFK